MAKSAEPLARSVPPLFIVLSGPSGVGKDAVLNRLKATDKGIRFVVTLTTRPRRPKEVDVVDYRFVSDAEFERLRNANELLEYANVYGNRYGPPKQTVREALTAGMDCLVKVDVQGAATIRKLAPKALLIFLMPPSLEVLAERLRSRYTESASQLRIRLETATSEIKEARKFDYIVMNDSGGLDAAVADIKAIIKAEKCRVHPREVVIP